MDAYVLLIGTVIAEVCNRNLPTFDDFVGACIKSMDGTTPILAVDELTALPDYDYLFAEFNDGDISGTNELHLLRIEGLAVDDRNGGAPGLLVHYKEDLRDVGYQPRPVYQV